VFSLLFLYTDLAQEPRSSLNGHAGIDIGQYWADMASEHTINGGADGLNGTAPQNKLLERVVRTPGRQPSPQPTHLSVPGSIQPRVLHETGSGYVAPKFEGRAQQIEEVVRQVDEKGFIPGDLVEDEVEWFYNELGIDDMYFSTETVEAVVSHIHSLYAAKVAAYARDDKKLEIRLDKEASDHAIYIDTSVPGTSSLSGSGFEARLEQKYLDGSRGNNSYRVETFRSPSKLPGGGDQALRCYFVYQTQFKNQACSPDETRIEELGDARFLQKTTANTRGLYQGVMDAVVSRTGPVIDM
jgi:glutamate dehydrogenase